MKTKIAMTKTEWIKQHPVRRYASGKYGWSKDTDIYDTKEVAKLAREDAAKAYMAGV